MINITFPDGAIREFEAGTTAYQVAESISPRLASACLAAKVNGEVRDLHRPITGNSTINFLKWDDDEGKATFWHSSAHLMAEALEALYPGIKLGIGPAISAGFYYDVDAGDRVISSNDLEAIEKKMIELAREKNEFLRKDISKADAIAYFTEKDDEYKLELL